MSLMDVKDGFRKFAKSAFAQVASRLKWWLTAAGGSVFVTSLFGEQLYWPRILLSFLVAFMLPLVFFPAIRSIVAKRSNGANAALLTGLTVFNILAGFFSVFWQIPGWQSALVVLVFATGGFFYAVWLMTFATKLEMN